MIDVKKKNEPKTIDGYNPFEEVTIKGLKHQVWEYGGFLTKDMTLTDFEKKYLRFRPDLGISAEEYWNWLYALLSKSFDERKQIEDMIKERAANGEHLSNIIGTAVRRFNHDNFEVGVN